MKRPLVAVSALGCLLFLTVAGCGPGRNPGHSQSDLQRHRGGVLRISAQSPESLDPAYSRSSWESEIVLQLFDGLLRYDQELNIAPALARDWQVSSDGKTYTFFLRHGVRFHNGREVTAEDFVFSLTRLLDRQVDSVDAEHYARIQGAERFRRGAVPEVQGLKALDRDTLQITLDRPYAPFLRVLAQQSASVVPKEEVQTRNSNFGRKPVGTGAYRLREWRPKEEIVLEANPDYYEGLPYIEEIRIMTVSPLNAQENYQNFIRGRVDIAFVPASQTAVARANRDWVFLSRPILRFMYLGFNLKAPLIKEYRFRRAVCLSINRAELIGSDPDYSALYNLLPLSLLGSSPESYKDPYDPGLARESLRHLSSSQRQDLEITLSHAVHSPQRERLLAGLVENLKAVGISVDLKIEPTLDALLARIYSGQTQMFVLGEVFDFPDPGALLNRLFHSKSQGNPFNYRNAEMDRRLEEALTILDETQRAQIYYQVERRILDDCVIAPLFQIRYSLVARRSLRGIEVGPLGFQYLPLRRISFVPEVNR